MDYLITQLPVNDDEGFVLTAPDFDSQNVMVDDDGRLMGIVDWDLASTMLRCIGYCRYPAWITRDWDPVGYGWPGSEEENSPEELKRYREYYDGSLGSHHRRMKGWEFTERSHMWGAICIAATDTRSRRDICIKFVGEAYGMDGNNSVALMNDIGAGRVEWDEVEIRLRALITGGTDLVTAKAERIEGNRDGDSELGV